MSTDPEQAAVATLRLTDPVQVGPHRLLGRLGGGGMGVVYLGDGPLGRVAIKIIRSELADQPSFRVRFQRELQACFRVSGRHTAKLLDFDITAEPPWLATEFLAAPTLGQHLTRHGALGVADQVRLAAGLADALVSIHTTGLIHRDLKPSNVMWTATGPIVIDFGVAAVRDAGQLTATGTLIGTPAWLAPEQITVGEVEAASDVFAWGALVGYGATGQPPYGEGPSDAVTYRIVHEEPRVDYARIAPPLRELVRRSLSREPGERPTAADLRAALVDTAGLGASAGGATAGTDTKDGGRHDGSGRLDGAALDVTLTVQTPAPSSGPPPSIPSPPPIPVGGEPPVGGRDGVSGVAGGTPPWNLSGAAGGESSPGDPAGGPRRRHRGRLLGLGVAVVVLAAAAVTAVLLTRGDSAGGGGTSTFTYTAAGPWRLLIADRQTGDDVGCTVSLHGVDNPAGVAAPDTTWGDRTFQVHQTGRFDLDVTPSSPGCRLTALPGGGDATLPFIVQQTGDSSAFSAPSRVEVLIKDFNGSETCELVLRDVASGENVDFVTATHDASTVTLDPGGRRQVYLAATDCAVRIGAAG
ncbi:serine/threonine-protein kinase [Frankia gtarii]|uniref:serine/threonine-protein kinase n=1 Tax=Frankia gtarii TaxID=2950102 RepID=UPI0021C19E77|nr:serine/threonine-protein kinase [Frankia gtarii]